MWRITIRGVIAHKARYGLTALAVFLGVAFVAGTLVFTDTINHTFDSLYTQIYKGTDAVVRARQAFNPGTSFTNQRDLIDASVQSTVDRVPGVAASALDIEGYAQLVGPNGKAIGHPANGPPTIGLAWIPVASLSPLRLVAGHAPVADDQIVVDRHSANGGHLRVGDRVTVLTKAPPAVYTISGIVTWGTTSSPLGATITAFTPATAARVLARPGKANQIDVAAAPGVSQRQLADRLQAALHDPAVEVVTGREITTEGQTNIRQALGFLSTFLLVFAGISLFVASYLIFNTFSITIAQRVREFGLLRAVGASRRQVWGAVAGESLVIGAVASAAGVLAGAGLAQLLKAGMGLLGFVVPASGLVFLPRTALVGMVVGTVVTVVAALAPARRASRITPVMAMAETSMTPSAPPARRLWQGLVVTGLGLALVAYALAARPADELALIGVAAVAVLIGAGRLGPFFARPVAGWIGAPFERFGASGHLGRDNARRNPGRTYTTASALVIGVALVSLMTVLASSIRATVDSVVDSAVRADFIVTTNAMAGTSFGLSPALAASIADLPQVAATTSVRSGVARVYGTTSPIIAVDTAHAAELFDIGVRQGRVAAMTPTGLAVSTSAAASHHLAMGSPVTVVFPTTGPRTFTVQAVYGARQLAGDYVLTMAAARANFAEQLDAQVYVGLAPGVTTAQGRRAIEAVTAAYPTAQVLDQSQYKAQQAAQVNQLLNLIYGLLALAVIIALIGIANTLALSIHERTHELGLLRAVGMTRGQVRASIRFEALIISLFGSLQGLVLGVAFGAALVSADHAQRLELSVPLIELLVVALVAGAAGLVAAGRPSRRAARIDILRAVTTE